MIKHIPIRTKIALGFILVSLFSLSIALSNNYFGKKIGTINNNQSNLLHLEQAILKKEKQFRTTQNNVRSNSFQVTAISTLMDSLKQKSNRVNQEILEISKIHHPIETNKAISQLKNLNESNTLLIKEYLIEQKNIGHKSFGLIGQFRNDIHKLEQDHAADISNEELLKIRRIEKDYLLRKEPSYVIRLNELLDTLNTRLTNNGKLQTSNLLLSYQKNFNLVDYAFQNIGNDTIGIQKSCNGTFNQMSNQIKFLNSKMSAQSKSVVKNYSIFQTSSMIILIALTTLAIIILSKQITKPIAQLDQALKHFVASDYKEHQNTHLVLRRDEIGSLIKNFNQIEKDVSKRFLNFKDNANERQNRLRLQNEKIQQQKSLLSDQKTRLEAVNKDHTDSLYYAQKLQKSLLPSSEKLTSIIGNHGIMFNPKDIVSGDFYWVEEREDNIYFAVGDCTGHGIPGAFLSILCTSFLNSAIYDKEITASEKILNYVSNKVAKALHQKGFKSEIKDGMDIALCVFNKKTNSLSYSGANRPLLILRGDELIEFKPDKFPIGWVIDHFHSSFTSYDVEIQKNDRLFLFTDGYADQFGGVKNKKLKYKRLKELIIESRYTSIKEQLTYLNQFMFNWTGYDNEQIDDICLLGVEITTDIEVETPVYNLSFGKNQQEQKRQQSINS